MKKEEIQIHIESRQLFSHVQQEMIEEEFPTEAWTQSWTQIENHIFTYLCASQTKLLFAYVSNKVRETILSHKNIDIIQHLRKQIATIFYKVFNTFVENQINEEQALKSFITQYMKLIPKLKVVVNCLYMHMSRFMTRGTIQKELNEILIKQLMKCSYYEHFVNDFIQLIEKYRDLCLIPSPITENTQLPSIQRQFQIIVQINMFSKIYGQYLEKSKRYYSQLLNRIPKNIQMFAIVNNYIWIETRLNKLLPIVQNNYLSLSYEQEDIRGILCKEVIDELYTNMIEYLDYLIGNEHNRQSSTIELQFIWNITKVLTSITKSNGYESRLTNRLIQIFSDIQKKIKDPQTLFQLIDHKETYHHIITKYFDDDPKFVNILNNTIEEVIMKEQQNYNSYLCAIILQDQFKCSESSLIYSQPSQTMEEIPIQFQYIFALFKLTPSKQQFMRKFEQEFSKYVLVNQCENLKEQQKFIKAIHKECGNALCKNIDRMLADVWRNGAFIEHKNQVISCRVLSKDWPEFTGKTFNLPDTLRQIRFKFEEYFLSFQENQKKKLEWVPQCGIIKLNICGVTSTFSELQASMVIILGKSFRPLKIKHFWEVLNLQKKELQKILTPLIQNQIFTYDQQSQVYELNAQNTKAYEYKLSESSIENKQKNILVRDYSILIEAHIARIMKRQKFLQKTDLMRLITSSLKTYRPDLEEINKAIEKLKARDIIYIQKVRGMIRYIQ